MSSLGVIVFGRQLGLSREVRAKAHNNNEYCLEPGSGRVWTRQRCRVWYQFRRLLYPSKMAKHLKIELTRYFQRQYSRKSRVFRFQSAATGSGARLESQTCQQNSPAITASARRRRLLVQRHEQKHIKSNGHRSIPVHRRAQMHDT